MSATLASWRSVSEFLRSQFMGRFDGEDHGGLGDMFGARFSVVAPSEHQTPRSISVDHCVLGMRGAQCAALYRFWLRRATRVPSTLREWTRL
eukprot:6190019-Pleurochrysis_carterae.AAC.2